MLTVIFKWYFLANKLPSQFTRFYNIKYLSASGAHDKCRVWVWNTRALKQIFSKLCNSAKIEHWDHTRVTAHVHIAYCNIIYRLSSYSQYLYFWAGPWRIRHSSGKTASLSNSNSQLAIFHTCRQRNLVCILPCILVVNGT